jgi:predicted metal-dependent hydrolase
MRFELGDITVDVIQKDIKNVHLSVNPPHGDVRISAPMSMNSDAIRAFAIDKLGWIKSERKKFLAQDREPAREFLDRESHHVWGKRYLLEIVEVNEAPSVELKHSKLLLKVRDGADCEKMKSVLDEWYRAQIKDAVPTLLAKYSSRLGVSVDRLFVQDMKTQWGSCAPENGSIRLNTDLARRSPEYLEYVVLHELAHLLESTHNARFTAIMDAQMPNWRHYRDELNRLPLLSNELEDRK